MLEAISGADLVVIAPSNPPLSIWPILAVPGVRAAVAGADRVVAVSPLFGGKALKGPADRVMASLGLPAGNAGVLAAYEGLLTDLVVDQRRRRRRRRLGGERCACTPPTPASPHRDAAARFARRSAGAAVTLSIHPVPGLPEIRPGDDLPALLADALAAGRPGP